MINETNTAPSIALDDLYAGKLTYLAAHRSKGEVIWLGIRKEDGSVWVYHTDARVEETGEIATQLLA